MSLKLTQNLVATGIRLRMGGVHRKFHTTQKKAFNEGPRYVTWEKFSEMNTQFINRFAAVEKGVAKSQSSTGAVIDSLNRLEDKVDEGFKEAKQQGEEINAQLTPLHGAQARTEGMMNAASWLLLPAIAFIAMLGYDVYRQGQRGPK